MISIYVITVALAVTAVGQSTHQPFNKLSAYFEVIHKTILVNNGTINFCHFSLLFNMWSGVFRDMSFVNNDKHKCFIYSNFYLLNK